MIKSKKSMLTDHRLSVEHVNTGNVIDNDQHKENYDKIIKERKENNND